MEKQQTVVGQGCPTYEKNSTICCRRQGSQPWKTGSSAMSVEKSANGNV